MSWMEFPKGEVKTQKWERKREQLLNGHQLKHQLRTHFVEMLEGRLNYLHFYRRLLLSSQDFLWKERGSRSPQL